MSERWVRRVLFNSKAGGRAGQPADAVRRVPQAGVGAAEKRTAEPAENAEEPPISNLKFQT